MARNKNQHRKQTEASKFLHSSEEGEKIEDVSESESPADSASEEVSEPSPEVSEQPKQESKPAVKKEEKKASEIPAKFRKFQ